MPVIQDVIDAPVQYYTGGIKQCKPGGVVRLLDFFKGIGEPKEEIVNICARINKADTTERQHLKETLPYFTPSVLVRGWRKYENIAEFTGFLPLDFDKVPDPAKFKEELFYEVDAIFAAWFSASGKGVRALAMVDKAEDIRDYKRLFWGFVNAPQINAGTISISQLKGFDPAPQVPVQPLFLSPDPEILLKTTFPVWRTRGDIPTEQTKRARRPKYIEPEERFARWAFQNTEKAIQQITDVGHPYLRAAAYSLGGYVAAGYITTQQAEDFINGLIVSHPYLSKKSSVYQRTAREMIRKGQSEPIYFKHR